MTVGALDAGRPINQVTLRRVLAVVAALLSAIDSETLRVVC